MKPTPRVGRLLACRNSGRPEAYPTVYSQSRSVGRGCTRKGEDMLRRGWCVVLVLAALPLAVRPASAALQEKPTVEKTAYGGWANNLKLSNGEAEVVLTLDVGPRVIH